MPVYIGSTSEDGQHDEFWTLEWGRRESDGLFGVLSWPSLSKIYLKNHNDLVGQTWQRHLERFANFVSRHETKGVLEIGSGHGLLSEEIYLKFGLKNNWHAIEPNPLKENPHGILIEGWFPEDLPEDLYFDTIVHSHVFEHQESPLDFAMKMAEVLPEGGTVILSLPNMEAMATNGDLNMLMFEHLTYLPRAEVEAIMAHAGFRPMFFEEFESHSYFMSFTKVAEQSRSEFTSTVTEISFSAISQNFRESTVSFAEKSNSFLDASDYPNYIFGAHVFSQYLFAMGLNENRIDAVVDNNPHKNGERLYGSGLKIISPSQVPSDAPVSIVLPLASYEMEVLEQLKSIAHAGTRILGLRTGLSIV